MKPNVAASAPSAYDSTQAGVGRPGDGPRKDDAHAPARPRRRDIDAELKARREALIDYVLAIYQPRTTRRLTREDGREIIENLAGFFGGLIEADRAARAKENGGEKPAPQEV